MHSLVRLGLLVCLFYATVLMAQQPFDSFVMELLKARDENRPIPNISHAMPIEMSQAYRVQNAYIHGRLKKSKLSGFKAGLTSKETQSHFSVARPIFGALFSDGDLSNVSKIETKHFRKMMIETEMGFITNRPIRKTIESIEELKSYIGQITPVIELPEIHFESHPVSGIDLVAANCAANGYIVDKTINWVGQNVNNITVALMRNGKIANEGQARDALGDQWEALRWLVNQVLVEGWSIDSGFLLITGVLGEMIPAEAGNYRAQFNDGSQMHFNLA